MCCNPWGCKDSDTTERLNWTEPQGKPKNTGVGSLFLLQGIFQTQESNPGLLHCRRILYQLSYKRNYSSALWDKMGKVIVLRQRGERKKREEWVVSSVQPHSWKWWWRARELRLADNQKDFRVGKPDLCFYIACHVMHGVLLPKCLIWIGMLCRYGGRDWALRVSWKDLEEIKHTERWTKIRGTKATFTLSQKFIESMRICGIL